MGFFQTNEGVIIYEVKDGIIQHAVFEKYSVKSSDNNSNSSTETNESILRIAIVQSKWWRECNGAAKFGSDTLTVNNG